MDDVRVTTWLGYSGGILLAVVGVFLTWGLGIALIVAGAAIALTFLTLIDADGSGDGKPAGPSVP